MHAHISRYEIQPGRIEERLRHHRDVVAPATRQRSGHRGVIILIDRTTHKNLTVVLWDSEADLRAAEQDPEFRTPHSHRRFAAGEFTTEYYEVAQVELPPDSGAGAPGVAWLTRFTVQPGRFDERLRFSREQMFPAARDVPGHQGALLFADRANEHTVAIALWRSAADIEAAADNAGYEDLRPHHHFAAGPVTHEQFEIAHYGLH
ncbi:MAG: antibiotic biosynthesis monooxygenase [Dehalococcoidia bacterium]